MQRLIDISGEKINKLTVLEFDHIGERRRSYWKCRCECGNEVILRKDSFYYPYSHIKSCGCWGIEERKGRPHDKKGRFEKLK